MKISHRPNNYMELNTIDIKLNEIYFFCFPFFKLKCSWFTILCQYLLFHWVTQFYTHIHSVLKCSFPFWFTPWSWVYFHVLYSMTLFIHSKYNSLHLPTPNPQPIRLPPNPNLLATTNLISMSASLFLFSRSFYLCHILDSICKWYHIVFAFLFLTYFT